MTVLENQKTQIIWTPYLATAYAEGFCEGEDASEIEKVEAFAYLLKTDTYKGLQGFFGRTIQTLINRGILTEDGEVDWDEYDNILEQYSYEN